MNSIKKEDLKNIETSLYEKFKKRQFDLFYFDGSILDYEEIIEKLAIQSYQFCLDEEVKFDQIQDKHFYEWIDKYDIPEKSCACNRGCKHCLGTEW